jgi:hypothetical protein
VPALVYQADLVDAVSILARSGAPGLVCGWWIWRGAELRRIAAVLLVSWPVSYSIYALQRADSDSGEQTIRGPVIICATWGLLA